MKREHWGGRLAFVMAAAGSAVGLGNIWKFPYITGIHGGAAFILVYLVCIFLVGAPIMLAELVIGRTTQKSPISAFKELAPKSLWWMVGLMGVLAGYVILSFYSVVAGWTLEYVWRSVQQDYTGVGGKQEVFALKAEYVESELQKLVKAKIAEFKAEEIEGLSEAEIQSKGLVALGDPKPWRESLAANADYDALLAYSVGKEFGGYIGSKTKPLLWHLVFMAITMFVVSAGVGGGIEKASKVLMPLLILIVLGIAIKGLTLEGSWAGVEFLIKPDFTKLSGESVLEALGHAFFTLSLGMGAMLTYGSYLDEDANLYVSGMMVVLADTLIALLAGFAIYPMIFAFGMSPSGGPGLIFITLPVLFSKMSGGYLIGGLFFVALFVAALTSAISLLEVCVAHFVDEWSWSRTKATLFAGVLIALLGVPSAIDFGFKVIGYNFFDFMDKLSTNVLLPVGGLFTSLFIGFAWNKEELSKAMGQGSGSMNATFLVIWLTLSRYVAPLLVLIVIANSFGLFGAH